MAASDGLTSCGENRLDTHHEQTIAQFKGKITKKRLDVVAENCDRLEWFGLVIAQPKDGITYWHYAEATQAA